MTGVAVERPLHVAVAVHHGLGDLVMALPTLVAVDRQLPRGSVLSLLVKSALEASMINVVQWTSHIQVFALKLGHSRSFGNALRRAMTLRSMRPDIFLAPHAAGGLMAASFARLVGSRFSVGPQGRWSILAYETTVSWPADQHKVKYYSRFAEVAGLIQDCASAVPLIISDTARATARELLGDEDQWLSVVIAPGASPVETHKLWPRSRYVDLAKQILSRKANCRIVLMGGPAERNDLRSLAAEVGDSRVSVLAQADLALTLGVLERAQCVVCPCTGPAHLAALVRTPIVGIYGPTNPSTTGPYTDRLRVIHSGMSCSPCYRPGFIRGCGNPLCMTTISAGEVADAVLDLLGGKPLPGVSKWTTTAARSPGVARRQ